MRATGRAPSTSSCSTTGGRGRSQTRSAATRSAASAARPASTSARSIARPAATPTTPRTPGRSARSCSRSSTRRRGASASLPFASTLCGACADVCPVRIDIPALLVHEREKVVAAKRPGPEAASMKLLGRVFRSRARYERAQRLARLLQKPLVRGGWIRRFPPGPLRAWGAAAICPPCRRRRSESGGSPMTARDVVLERVRQAVAGAPPAAVPRRYASRARRRTRVVEAFVDRVRDYRATVLQVDDAAAAVAEVLAAQGARRIGIPQDLDARLRPAGVELVEDDALSPQQLDELDGALTTCAAPARSPGRSHSTAGPGQGRRALTLLPDLHVCVVRGGPDRRDRARARAPPRARRERGPPARPRLGPVRDLRHRARSASRASTARAGSS